LNAEQLREYVTVMREMGVQTFRSGDLEISLGAAPVKPPSARDSDAPVPAPKKTEYERLLFAATEGFDPDEE